MLPYGRQIIEDDDIAAVVATLKSDFLTGGPEVARSEEVLAETVGARHAVVCANGTAALHLAALALDLKAGDRVIVPAITFLATANAARYVGAEVEFCDVDGDTGQMTAETLEAAFARATGPVRAVFPVALAGQTADRLAIAEVARRHGAAIVDDACHALGSEVTDSDGVAGRIGDCRFAAMAAMSFHPVKTVTAGEGGAVLTNDAALYQRLLRLRNHGMTRDPAEFQHAEAAFDANGVVNPWYYEMPEVGFNYRLDGISCALLLSQLGKLPRFIRQRRVLAAEYDRLLAPLAPLVRPVPRLPGNNPCLHLYGVLIDFPAFGGTRGGLMRALAARGVGTQVHYIPVPHQPYYRQRYGECRLPGAEAYYARCLSLPLFPAMSVEDVARVVEVLAQEIGRPGGGTS